MMGVLFSVTPSYYSLQEVAIVVVGVIVSIALSVGLVDNIWEMAFFNTFTLDSGQ